MINSLDKQNAYKHIAYAYNFMLNIIFYIYVDIIMYVPAVIGMLTAVL